jgi:uncharacterized protein
VLVLWPLLIPLGSFYNSLQSGEIDLPWASIAGFVDVMAIMFAAVWLAHRRERRAAESSAEEISQARGSDVKSPSMRKAGDEGAGHGNSLETSL